MSDQPKRFFDLWFVQANTVTKEVPFHVVTDWIQQGRAAPADKVKPSGTADWYDLGFRDAIFGLQRQEGFYEHECAPHGVKVDVARYVQGWNEGRYEADYRNPQPIH